MNPLARAIMMAQGAPSDLDLSTWGAFTRASEASYVIGSPNAGEVPFLGWAPKDVRRIDRRNATPRYLTEGSRTNLLGQTERMDGSFGPSIPGGVTLASTLFPSPDGNCQKGRIQTAGDGPNFTLTGIATNQDWSASAWYRAPSGTQTSQSWIGWTTLTCSSNASLTSTWWRARMLRRPDNAIGQIEFCLADGRNWSSQSGGITAGARDVVAWGYQLEQASFPTSYIRTIGYGYGAVTRSADALSGPIASIPQKMIDGAWSFSVAPVGDSTGMVRQNATQTLFAFASGGGETIEFYITGAACYLRVVSGGSAKVTSSALTFSADQELTVTLDGAAGSLTVAGATTGNGTVTGTPWTRTVGTTLYVGARDDGSNPAFAGLWCTGAPTPAVSAAKRVVFTLGQSNMTSSGMHDRVASNIQSLHPDSKLIDGSMGSTSLAVDWAAPSGSQYVAAVAKWNAAVAADPTLTAYTPIIVWIHGESDAANAGYATAYGANLAALKTNLETDIPQLVGAKWLVGQLPSTTTLIYGATLTTIGQVRSAQAAFVAGLGSQAAVVDPSDLALDGASLHFIDASTHVYAARMGAAAESIGA